MRPFLSVALTVTVVALLASVAFAQMGRGPMTGGMGQGMMMGPGMMGGQAAKWSCPGMAAAGATQAQITEEKAKELATEYAAKYLKGFTIERVLPFAGHMGTAYQIELKGSKGETKVLHVNPWGAVRPFGPVAATE